MKKTRTILVLLAIIVTVMFFVACDSEIEDVAETPPIYVNDDNIENMEENAEDVDTENEEYCGTEQFLTEDNDSSFSEILRMLNKMFDIEDFEFGEERIANFVHPDHGPLRTTWQTIDLLGEQISLDGLERIEVSNMLETQIGDILRVSTYVFDSYSETWVSTRRIMIDIGPAPDWSPQYRAYYVIYLG